MKILISGMGVHILSFDISDRVITLVLSYLGWAIGLVMFSKPGNLEYTLDLDAGFCFILRGNLIIWTEFAGYYARCRQCAHTLRRVTLDPSPNS